MDYYLFRKVVTFFILNRTQFYVNFQCNLIWDLHLFLPSIRIVSVNF